MSPSREVDIVFEGASNRRDDVEFLMHFLNIKLPFD